MIKMATAPSDIGPNLFSLNDPFVPGSPLTRVLERKVHEFYLVHPPSAETLRDEVIYRGDMS
jgi:hypothetical protein